MSKYRETYRDIGKASGIIVALTLVDKVFAVFKEIIVADRFGISSELDAFNIAASLPALIILLFTSAFIGAFVPLYLEWKNKSSLQQANADALTLVLLATLFCGLLTAICFLLTPRFYPLIGYGFEPGVKTLGIDIEKLLVFLILIEGAGIILAGILHAQKQFFNLQFAPIFINITIIFFLIFFREKLGILSLAWGFLLGTLGKVFYMAFMLGRGGFNFLGRLKFDRSKMLAFVFLAVPLLASELISNANLLIDQVMATTLDPGSVSTLRYAFRINDMPIQVVIMAISIAIFPFISEQALKGDYIAMGDVFKQSVIFLGFLTLPIICLVLLFSQEVVAILFQRGAFDHHATHQTAQTLLLYSLGLFFLAYTFINGAFFSALKKTKTLFYMGCLTVTLNISFNVLFMRIWGVKGIALSTTFTLGIVAFLFMFLLKQRIQVDFTRVIANFSRLLLAATGMFGAGVYLKNYLVDAGIDKFFYLPVITIVISSGYLLMCWILRTEELTLYLNIIGKPSKRKDS